MTQSKQSKWTIDTGHSTIQCKVKHLAITHVTVVFRQFEGEVTGGETDFDDAIVRCRIDVNSLDTNNETRDGHLKSAGFFDVQAYPSIGFDGRLKKTGDQYQLEGELTIRDVTRPVVMEVEFAGIAAGRFNDTRAGFEANGKISRKAFGLAWDVLTEAGGLVIGDEIRLYLAIQLIKLPA